MSATVTIPAGITVIVDDGSHDLAPGTYPVHATTVTGQQVPTGARPHFLEVDLPTGGTTGIGIILVRIPAYDDRFPAQTTDGPVLFAIDGGPAIEAADGGRSRLQLGRWRRSSVAERSGSVS